MIYLDQLDNRKNVIRGEVISIDMENALKLQLDVDGEVQYYQIHPQAMLVSRGKQTQIAPKDRQFGSKTVAQRAMAIFAGPLMNFILALFFRRVCTDGRCSGRESEKSGDR